MGKEIECNLNHFFEANNIEYKDIYIRKDVNGYAVFAEKDLKVGDVVCTIPKEAVLSVRTTAIADLLEENQLGGTCALSLAVMYEWSVGEKSPWYLYLKSIPLFEPVPVFWCEDDVKYLGGTDVGRALDEDIEFLTQDYNEIIVPLFEKYSFLDKDFMSLELWKRANSLVSSRAFEVDAYHGESLVPFADLFNHKTDGEHVHIECFGDVCETCGAADGCGCANSDEEWEDDDENECEDDESIPELEDFIPEHPNNSMEEDSEVDLEGENNMLEMVIVRDCKAREEVFNTYGQHSNTSLLRLYGFIDQPNPFSAVSVAREELIHEIPDSQVEFLEDRIAFWDQVGKDIIDQLEHLDEEDEGCQDGCCEEDHDHVEEEENEHEHSGDCCSGEENEMEEDRFSDDFFFESNGNPSFAMNVFSHLILMSNEMFENVAMDLEAAIQLLVSLKEQKQITKGKNKTNQLTEQVNDFLGKVARNRLASYPVFSAPVETLGKNAKTALSLQQEEISILNHYLNN